MDIYNPSTLKSSCGDVAVWVDTSGSVSDKEKKHALGELNAIAEDMQLTQLQYSMEMLTFRISKDTKEAIS